MRLIDFEQIAWESHGPGLRFKRYERGEKRVRLMEFFEGFREKEHCLNGHMVQVLEGTLSIQFDDALEEYHTGDTFLILPGEDDRHKVVMKKGESALILSFETQGDRS